MESDQLGLISHDVMAESLANAIAGLKDKIIIQGDKPHTTVKEQLDILDQLSEFQFGRFLIQHQGINGYWTHYMLTHPWFGRKTGKDLEGNQLTELECYLLDKSPVLLATQQRFEIFLKENQKIVKNDATLACIPSGLMGELLYLDYSHIDEINLIGIDFDASALKCAVELAEKRNLSQWVSVINENAWHLSADHEYDLISSNGLNIYEPSNDRVIALYKEFYQALKTGGKLVTSFITPPPTLSDQSSWKMGQINQADLRLQQIIFSDILGARWQCFRTEEETFEQLTKAGFKDINFIYDKAHIFPTVVAFK
ncbi:methyltransferase domain-containing protein [Thiotrichales bacterium 19S3-7]|nr:methyltransferase domain-containing protein [Thiotrichales bacterium 19S3-7]MCF6802770.1 methyltransferase domain-containing protein [Thiotrichales bacterium 19S3-11]